MPMAAYCLVANMDCHAIYSLPPQWNLRQAFTNCHHARKKHLDYTHLVEPAPEHLTVAAGAVGGVVVVPQPEPEE